MASKTQYKLYHIFTAPLPQLNNTMRRLLALLLVLFAVHAAAITHLQHPHTRIRAKSEREALHIATRLGATLHGPTPVEGYYSASLPDTPVPHANVRIVHPTEFALHNETAPVSAPAGAWIADMLGVVGAWAVTDGTGARVMAIDSSATLAHPDLAGVNASLAWSVWHNNSDVASPYGEEHGTAVSSVIVGVHDDFCASGLAPGADLVFVKLIDPAVTLHVTSTVLAAVLAHRPPGAPVDVITLSVGPPGRVYTPLEDVYADVFNALATRGTVVVWSAGNDRESYAHLGFNEVTSHVHVLAAAAVDATGAPMPYSTPGGMLALAAPAASADHRAPAAVGSADCLDTFGGTSRAAPGIASLAALVRAAHPTLTAADIADVLFVSAVEANRAPADVLFVSNAAGMLHSYDVGFGVPNATRALELAAARTERWTLRRVAVPLHIPRAVFLNNGIMTATVADTARVAAAYLVSGVNMDRCAMNGVHDVEIVSPSGTVAPALRRPNAMYGLRQVETLRLGTRAFHRENAAGAWTVRLTSLCATGTEVVDPVLELWLIDAE